MANGIGKSAKEEDKELLTSQKDYQVLEQLEVIEKEEGYLPPSLHLYRDLLQISDMIGEKIGSAKVAIPQKAISNRIEQGFPVLSFDDMNVDLEIVRELFPSIVDAFSRHQFVFGRISSRLKKSGAMGLIQVRVMKAWFDGDKLPFIIPKRMTENQIRTILQFTIRPWLKAYASALIVAIDLEKWRRRYCPICGGKPDFAYLDKERGARWLLCSRCDSEWLFQRVECPYCNTQDQDALHYFMDENELYRVSVCDRCNCYLKTIDLRKTEREIIPQLERFFTGDMDKQAWEQNYQLPT